MAAFRILITEDDGDVRALLKETLEAHGYEVGEAGGLHEALRLMSVENQPFDLLLTDLTMPGGSGRDLGRQVTALWPKLKVLYMSGYGEPGSDRASGLEAGDPFLPKPFTRQQLLNAVANILG